MTPRNAAAPAEPDVHELVRQRDLLRGWIAKLDEVKAEARSHVAERVRADYQERLRRVTDDLSAHHEEVERSLEAARAELTAAAERHDAAGERLEETRLRHLIGELDQGAWNDALPALESEVAATGEALQRATGEVERLTSLAGDLRPGAAAEAATASEDAKTASGDGDAAPSADADGASGNAWDAPAAAAADESAGGGARYDAAPAADAVDDDGFFANLDGGAAAADPAPAAAGDEDVGSWISDDDVGAAADPDATVEEPAAPASEAQAIADEADSWDPFANEFGGPPPLPDQAAPPAADELPWLDALDGNGAAEGWESQQGHDDLAFLKDLETGPAAEPAAEGDLAADDLAFLEELDRAISGGTARQPAPAQPPAAPPSGGITNSGDVAPDSTADQRKRGEALLCKECGAINEPQAWYCEICGSEL